MLSLSADDTFKSNESIPNRDISSIYQEQRVQPCHLSSSIYYGGQDVYSHPQNTQSPGLNSTVSMCNTNLLVVKT